MPRPVKCCTPVCSDAQCERQISVGLHGTLILSEGFAERSRHRFPVSKRERGQGTPCLNQCRFSSGSSTPDDRRPLAVRRTDNVCTADAQIEPLMSTLGHLGRGSRPRPRLCTLYCEDDLYTLWSTGARSPCHAQGESTRVRNAERCRARYQCRGEVRNATCIPSAIAVLIVQHFLKRRPSHTSTAVAQLGTIAVPEAAAKS